MPYTNKKGVVHLDVRKDMQYAHDAKESFSYQSQDISTIFRRILLMFLFAALTAPLVCGLYANDRWCRIPYS